jgi:uncharacterized protein (TIRG00374 family)
MATSPPTKGATEVDEPGPAQSNPAPSPLIDVSEARPRAGSWFALGAGWVLGALILAGVVVFVLRFGDIEIFLKTLRKADPIWLAAALSCQFATYLCAAALWSAVLRKAKSPLPLLSLLRLALMELFANQAIPTGGLSGSLMVVRGLTRRGVAPAIAITALLIEAISYYAAFFLVGLLAFVLFWHNGDLTTAWRSLFVAFAVAVAAAGTALVIVSRAQGELIPKRVLQWRPFAELSAMLDQVRADLLRSPRLVVGAVALQLAVFLLDTATLWCASRAIGLDLDVARTFTSFVLASVVATLSPIPLGLGAFEGSCTGLLHLLGGGLEASLAATLILRGLTLWLPMLPGLWIIRREMVIAKT